MLALTYGNGELRLVDAQGRLRRQLLGPGPGIDDPAWSPNGRRIAFVRHVGPRRARLAAFVIDAAGGVPRRLTPGFRGMGALSWSPDGRSLAFSAQVSDVRMSVFVLGPARRLRRILAVDVGQEPMSISWLSNRRLGFCVGHSPRWQALTMTRAGRVVSRERGGYCPSFGPFWSPSGALELRVRGDSRSNGQLVLEDRQGHRAWLTRDRPGDREAHFNHCCASWSPDGSRIAFLSTLTDPGTRDVFVVNADGSGERRLTWGQDIQEAPRFSGDGSWIALRDYPDLTVLSLRTGRVRRLPAKAVSGFDWRPVPDTRVREPGVASLARLPVRDVRVDRSEYGVEPGRLREVRVLRDRLPGDGEAMSPDGRLVAFTTYERYRYGVTLLDLASDRLRRLPGSSVIDEKRLGDSFGVVGFSPDSKQLLLRSGRRLVTVDVRTRERRVVARHVPWGPAGWLADGRVAFVDGQRRLVFATPGGRVGATRFRAPRLTYSEPTWSPDGRSVLYARRCSVWMLDLRTGKRLRIAGSTRGDGATFGSSPGPWSPNGRYYLLQTGAWDDHCTYFESMGSNWSVRSAAGTRLGRFETHGGAEWSTDSRSILGFPYVTGTEVTKMFPLEVFDLRTRKAAELLRDRFVHGAFLGPGGWLVYGRYVTSARFDDRVRLYLARLSPRWR